MRKTIAVIAIYMGVGLTIILQSFLSYQIQIVKAEENMLYVSANDPICGENAPCFANIQEAVSAATTGDRILVAGGYYTDTDVAAMGYLVGITESITIQGGYDEYFSTPPNSDANPTMLDAQGNGRVILISGDISPTIEGVRLTGGDATGLGGGYPSSVGDDPDAGGGIYMVDANTSFQNIQVYTNTARQGGGIYQSGGIASFENAKIFSNTVTVDILPKSALGGGVFLNRSVTDFDNCMILDNHAVISGTATWSSGGGIYTSISDVHFRNNTIAGNSAIQPGGGILVQSSDVSFIRNTVNNNSSIYSNGGGISIGNSDVSLTENTVRDNSSRYYGGGLDIGGNSQATLTGNIITNNTSNQRNGGGLTLRTSEITMTNNIISENYAHEKGSGMLIEGANVRMDHNTISSNTGGDGIGIFINHFKYASSPTLYPSEVDLTNTIIVSHTIGISLTTINTATLDGILWYNNIVNTEKSITSTLTIQNQFTGDPMFDIDGYHLTSGSAAIDNGVFSNVHLDIDHEPRFLPPDLGADEYWAPGVLKRIYLPLIFR